MAEEEKERKKEKDRKIERKKESAGQGWPLLLKLALSLQQAFMAWEQKAGTIEETQLESLIVFEGLIGLNECT